MRARQGTGVLVAGLTAVALLVGGAGRARADLITGTITGQVFSAGSSVPGITVGSPVTGTYTYDSSMIVNDIVGPVNPLTDFSLTIGNNPHVFTLADLQTINTPGRDIGHSSATTDSLFFFFDFAAISAYVGAPVNSQSIGNTLPQDFFVGSDAAHSFSFHFAATPGAPVPAVPEPGTLALLGLGLAALGRLRRHRKDATA